MPCFTNTNTNTNKNTNTNTNTILTSPSFPSFDWGSWGWCLASQTPWWRRSGRVELLCVLASYQAEKKIKTHLKICKKKVQPYFHPGVTLRNWWGAWRHQCDLPQWQRGVGLSPWYGSCKRKSKWQQSVGQRVESVFPAGKKREESLCSWSCGKCTIYSGH